jgi:hypothetical protein
LLNDSHSYDFLVSFGPSVSDLAQLVVQRSFVMPYAVSIISGTRIAAGRVNGCYGLASYSE